MERDRTMMRAYYLLLWPPTDDHTPSNTLSEYTQKEKMGCVCVALDFNV
jgi:hypothetical protein